MKESVKTLVSLVPIVVLVALLSLSIGIYGSEAILGASQVSLLAAALVSAALSMFCFKTPWKSIEEAIKGNVSDVTTAIIILFLIGAISGTWTVSGIIPTLICYGVKIISPKVFLLTCCVICALISVMIGSSWTTIATVGVALLGIGRAEGFSDAMTAGAIISGAYFGDKLSPLSDTTVLASTVSRVPLFEHIRYLMVTTVPSMVLTLIIFTVLGLTHGGGEAARMDLYEEVLSTRFRITPWVLVVPVLTGIMIGKKWPALVVLSLSALLAAVAALLFQPAVIEGIGASLTEGSRARVLFAGTVESIYNSVTVATGVPEVDSLVSTRGMLGMLNTAFLIISAMCFGGCMKAGGMISHIASMLCPLTRSRTGLVSTTVVTGTALNGIVSDQSLSIILTSDIYGEVYRKNGYEARLLSRSVEDSATITSPLFPWSSCGMTQATILSVPTLVYLPYCFFNIISPLMSILVAAIGWRIFRKTPSDGS